jgi:hypothetical protein
MNALRLAMIGLGVLGLVAGAEAQERFTAPQPRSILTNEAPAKPAAKSLLSTASPFQQTNYEQAPVGLPEQPIMPGGVPGAVYSPWVGGDPAGGCCGPVGANGPVTYESYIRTGVSLLSGGGELKNIMETYGWNVTGGARTLFFDPAGDSAWAIDFGIGYTRNTGRGLSRTTNIELSQLKGGIPAQTDQFAFGSNGMNRTSFNFGLGRDYFLNGPGVVGMESYGNTRLGWDIGGKYGTSSIDLIPENEPNGYRRRQAVYHGLTLGSHYTWEIPMRSWTFVVGGRVEWSYYWMNMIPPQDSDIRDVNILMMFGVRF